MTNVLMKQLEDSMKMTAFLIQRELRKPENISNFTLEITAEARVEGDIKIEYRLALDYESGVRGNKIQDVLVEAMRRKGWQVTHRPTMISHVTGEEIQED